MPGQDHLLDSAPTLQPLEPLEPRARAAPKRDDMVELDEEVIAEAEAAVDDVLRWPHRELPPFNVRFNIQSYQDFKRTFCGPGWAAAVFFVEQAIALQRQYGNY